MSDYLEQEKMLPHVKVDCKTWVNKRGAGADVEKRLGAEQFALKDELPISKRVVTYVSKAH